jgi:hypothetical protein
MVEILTILEHELLTRKNSLSITISRCANKSNIGLAINSNQYNRKLVLIGNHSDSDYENVLDERSNPEVAVIVSAGNSNLYLAFDEKWRQIEPPKGSKSARARASPPKFEFDGLHIRFYLGSRTGYIKQFARYEWEPLRKKPQAIWKDEDQAEYLYDGQGAAHPHFHIDALQIDFKKQSFSPISQGAHFGGDGNIDYSENDDLVGAGWLQHVHIPLRALWEVPSIPPHATWHEADATKALPHQHQPKSIDELSNWFEWVINYTVHQFEANSSRT